MRTRHRNRWLLSVLVSLCLTLCACSSGSNAPAPDPKPSGTEDTASSGSRDATPQVLTPEAGGTDVRQCDVAEVDVSNMSEGYIMVNYTGGNAKAKLQLCSDCCGDRSSNLLLAAYHRCCQHDRPHYRCLPGIPAAPDLHPACLRSSGSGQPEAHPVRIR